MSRSDDERVVDILEAPSRSGPVRCTPMARRADDLSDDPVLVLIKDEVSDLTVEQWLASLKEDGATDVNANAVEFLREIREHDQR